MKSVSLLCGALLFGLSYGQPPIDGDCLPDPLCTKVEGAGNVAKGLWEYCGDNGGLGEYCKGGKVFSYYANQYNLFYIDSQSSILGYCMNTNPQTIFDCSGQYHNTVREKPDADFAQCCVDSRRRRRRRLIDTSCWGSHPRVISFVGAYMFPILWSTPWLFVEFRADPDAGCHNSRPVYKTRPITFPQQYTLKWNNNRWEITYGNYQTTAYCTQSNLLNCNAYTWQGSGMGILNLGVVFNEYMACQYMEDTRDILLDSQWISNNGGFPGQALPMSIDMEERCFFARPAWIGFSRDANPSSPVNYAFYISFESQNTYQRWIINYDYIDYTKIIYECNAMNFGDLKECSTFDDWHWLWDTEPGWEPDWPISLSVASTGPTVYSTPPPVPTFDHWPSNLNTLAACAFFNFAIMAVQCVYKKNAASIKMDSLE